MEKIDDINLFIDEEKYDLAEINYIKIEKDLVPYSFTYDYEGNIFEMVVNYNDEFDFFTIDLYLMNNEEKILLISCEKIILCQMLFLSIAYLNIAIPSFIPYDFSNSHEKAGFNEIDSIYLVVVEDDFI